MKKTKEEAITLIALIITVIVMLILAGVAINLSIGDNGIFKKTQEASEISKKASIKEELELKIADLEFQKIKEGQTLNKEDIAERLPGMGVEVIDQTDKIIEGETEEYPIIIDENNKVTVGDKLVGEKPTGAVEILTEEDGVEEVEIRVTGAIEEGEITAIETTNGAELKTEESATSKIFKVVENGRFYFKIKASNGRSVKISCDVTNVLTTSVDLLTAIKETTNSGVKKVKVVGSESTEIYSLNVIRHEGDMVLNGSTTFEGATLANKVYEFGNSTQDVGKNTIVLKVEGDLTINSGVTLTSVIGNGGPKGLIVYCTGTLTNNGTMSMSGRGARVEGQNVYIHKKADNTFEFVPKVGAVGGAAASINTFGCRSGIRGNDASKRMSGGGGSGACGSYSWSNYMRSGMGGSGNSYSGGNRWWSSYSDVVVIILVLLVLLKAVERVTVSTILLFILLPIGASLGGGLLVVRVETLEGTGVFTACGSSAGNPTPTAQYAGFPGGSSGGGNINVFYKELSMFSGSYDVSGGTAVIPTGPAYINNEKYQGGARWKWKLCLR